MSCASAESSETMSLCHPKTVYAYMKESLNKQKWSWEQRVQLKGSPDPWSHEILFIFAHWLVGEYWILPLTRGFSLKGRKHGSEQPEAEGEMGPTCPCSSVTALTVGLFHYKKRVVTITFYILFPKYFNRKQYFSSQFDEKQTKKSCKTYTHEVYCLSTEWIDASVCCFEHILRCRVGNVNYSFSIVDCMLESPAWYRL